MKFITLVEKILLEADPKKGTGKKPKGSGRRLYTDENPKDTVGVKFSSAAPKPVSYTHLTLPTILLV